MKIRIALLAFVVALAGCSGSSTSSIQNNAGSSVITLETPTGTIVPNTVISVSTDIANNAPLNVVQTVTTNTNGQATITNIPPSGVYCVSATVPGNTGGTLFVGQCIAPFPSSYTLQ